MLRKLVSRTLFRVLRGMEWLNRRYSVHGDRPFFNPDDFAWTREVEKHTAAIQKELDELLLQVERLPNFQDISPDQAMLTTDARWKTFADMAVGEGVYPKTLDPKRAYTLAFSPK